MRKLLNKYNASIKAIHRFFGYKGDWTIFPIEDNTDCYWFINDDKICFYENMEKYEAILKEYLEILENSEDEFGEKEEFDLSNISGEYEVDLIMLYGEYRIYEKDKYTAIIVDTHTDDNKLFSIWDNSKKIIPPIKEVLKKPKNWIGPYNPEAMKDYKYDDNGGSIVDNLMGESEVNEILKTLNDGTNINPTTE